MRKKYTDEDIIREAANVKTMAQLLAKLDLKPVGGNYANMKRNLQRLNISADHWTGQAWNKGQQLKEWGSYTKTDRYRVHLIAERGRQCENCGIEAWQEKPIVLELHHVDGDRTNNNKENLQLLCPNCHSYTDTWRRQK